MATPSAISAFITQAQATGLTFVQMRDALRYAIVSGITDDGRVVTSVGSDGTSLGFASIDAAINALNVVQQLAVQEQGPQILNAEFAPAGTPGYSGGWQA